MDTQGSGGECNYPPTMAIFRLKNFECFLCVNKKHQYSQNSVSSDANIRISVFLPQSLSHTEKIPFSCVHWQKSEVEIRVIIQMQYFSADFFSNLEFNLKALTFLLTITITYTFLTSSSSENRDLSIVYVSTLWRWLSLSSLRCGTICCFMLFKIN